MGNRQDKALRPGVHQPETQLVVMMGAVHRVLLDVMQGVVHPAHVPFVIEPQATLLGRLADARPGRGLFGNHQGARGFKGNHVVQVPQEVDGFQVLATAMAVGHPFTGLARIIAIQHGGHCVHAQAIDVEMLEPVQGRREHETVDLGAAQVVDQRVPVLVKAFQGVGVFVQRGTVKLRQAVGIGGEMRGYPIKDHADIGLMAGIDEPGEVFRRAKARAGGKLG